MLFGISKSQTHRVIKEELKKLVSEHLSTLVNINNWVPGDIPPTWPNHIGVVDCTELIIHAWHRNAFSKKKARHTLKYQVVININTGKPLQIFGPFKGSVHDSKVFHKSGLSQWLLDNNVKILGDKAYVGCAGVTAPHKRVDGRRLPAPLRAYNKKLAQKRILVENHFAHLKKWKVLSYVYRGNIETHQNIFFACEILEAIEK